MGCGCAVGIPPGGACRRPWRHWRLRRCCIARRSHGTNGSVRWGRRRRMFGGVPVSASRGCCYGQPQMGWGGFGGPGLLPRGGRNWLGVALARSVLVQPELDAGRLVRPVPHSVPAAFAYYVVYPADAPMSAQLAALRDWLLAQTKTLPAVAGESLPRGA